jgi:hypothetical protein
MEAVMRKGRKNLKILGPIILRVAINVMDMLVGPKFPMQLGFHDRSIERDTGTVSANN